MGEAKRRGAFRNEAFPLIASIPRKRFNHYAIGTRHSMMHHLADELSWSSAADDRLLGMVLRDWTDDYYGWIVLAIDRIGRFRAVLPDTSLPSASRGEEMLRLEMARVAGEEDIAVLGDQADTPNAPVDLLAVPTGAGTYGCRQRGLSSYDKAG